MRSSWKEIRERLLKSDPEHFKKLRKKGLEMLHNGGKPRKVLEKKHCSKCKEEKSIDQFEVRAGNGFLYYNPQCNECKTKIHKISSVKYNNKHKDKILPHNKELNKGYREELADSYIVTCLTKKFNNDREKVNKLCAEYPEILTIHRNHIKTYRANQHVSELLKEKYGFDKVEYNVCLYFNYVPPKKMKEFFAQYKNDNPDCTKIDYFDYCGKDGCWIDIEGSLHIPDPGLFACQMRERFLLHPLVKKLEWIQIQVKPHYFRWYAPERGWRFIKGNNGDEISLNELIYSHDKFPDMELQKHIETYQKDKTSEQHRVPEMAVSVQDLYLSVRAQNILRGAEIKTVYDLINYDTNKLGKIRNCGVITKKELEETIKKIKNDY